MFNAHDTKRIANVIVPAFAKLLWVSPSRQISSRIGAVVVTAPSRFGQTVPPAPGYIDLNGDLGVSLFDFPAFQQQFGRSVTFDAPTPTASPSQSTSSSPTPVRQPQAAPPVLYASVGEPASLSAARDVPGLSAEPDAPAAPPPSLLAAALAAPSLKLRPATSGIGFSASDMPWSDNDDQEDSPPDFLAPPDAAEPPPGHHRGSAGAGVTSTWSNVAVW